MADKEPRDRKEARAAKSDDKFQAPAVRSADQGAESDEEATVNFAEPQTGNGYTEDASAIEAQPQSSGIPQVLLEIKQQIENGLSKNASVGAVNAEDLDGAANIVGVSIGMGEPNSSPGTPGVSTDVRPGEYALNVYVQELTSVDQVKSVIVEAMGAAAASEDALPINILQTGLVEAQPHQFRIRPAPGGVSVSHYKVTAGTIGGLCVGRTAPRNSRLMVLSNNHVLANSNSAVYGDCICQPGTYDGGKCPADQIAILERFVTINFSGGANYVDCATGWAWPDRVRRDFIYRSGSGFAFFRLRTSVPFLAPLGTIVGKTGRTTQLTMGRVTGIGATINVNYGGGRVARFVDQIAIQSVNSNPFSAGGDSGSGIWTWSDLRPVGLLFAGGGGVTFANRMDRVVAALDVNLSI